jgi:hypothetical protein
MNRKKLVMLVLLVPALVILINLSYYLFFLGGVLGYAGGRVGGGKKAGVQGRIKSLIFGWGERELHLHHWLIACLTLCICGAVGFYLINSQLFYGSFAGLAAQGIYAYDDWHKIIKPRSKLPLK